MDCLLQKYTASVDLMNSLMKSLDPENVMDGSRYVDAEAGVKVLQDLFDHEFHVVVLEVSKAEGKFQACALCCSFCAFLSD